jgi:hypothetical protein
MFGPTQYQQDARSANASIADLWKQMNGQYGGNADQALSIFGSAGNDLHGRTSRAPWASTRCRRSSTNCRSGRRVQREPRRHAQKIQALGGNVGEALRPYLEQLADAKTLTQDNLDLIAKMAGDAVPDYKAVEAAAQRLGISDDHLGQSFQQAKQNASWQSIIDDLDTLTRERRDLNALFDSDTGLQKTINDLVQQSIKFGTTIPANMRPWIQQLIDSGKLLGDDHKAITDINQLHFGGDMQTTLDHLNDTLKALIDALNVGLPECDAARRPDMADRVRLDDRRDRERPQPAVRRDLLARRIVPACGG